MIELDGTRTTIDDGFVMATLHATSSQRAKLDASKAMGRHLEPPRGLMIDDPECLAIIDRIAERTGQPRHEIVKLALLHEAQRLGIK